MAGDLAGYRRCPHQDPSKGVVALTQIQARVAILTKIQARALWPTLKPGDTLTCQLLKDL